MRPLGMDQLMLRWLPIPFQYLDLSSPQPSFVECHVVLLIRYTE